MFKKKQQPTQSSSSVTVPHRKKMIGLMIIGAVVVLGFGGFLAWQWWPKGTKQAEYTINSGDKAAAQTQVVSKEARESIYDTIPSDNTPEQKEDILVAKMTTAEVGKDYTKLVQYAKEYLALPGFSNNTTGLIELANGYRGLEQKSELKDTLLKLKSFYETAGQTSNYYYSKVTEELKGL
jgi:hypothetical protein